MNWLLHNPIADLRGPDFLALYATVIIATLVLVHLYLRSRDTTGSLHAPPVPPKIDPLETAFLRGNRAELIHVLILGLIDRNYLETAGTPAQILHAKGHPDPRHLSPVEREIFDLFATPQNAWSAARLADTGPLFDRLAKAYEQKLHAEFLLCPPAVAAAAVPAGLAAAALILGLGGYKLCIALSRGRTNVGFLIALGILSTIVLLVIVARAGRHTSARGRAYLAKLELAFDKLRERAALEPAAHLAADALLLLAAIYGTASLAKTPWKNYAHLFAPPQQSSSSSCGSGSSCGSSSSSGGSSCGGGGGGGGCGGCGGGGGD